MVLCFPKVSYTTTVAITPPQCISSFGAEPAINKQLSTAIITFKQWHSTSDRTSCSEHFTFHFILASMPFHTYKVSHWHILFSREENLEKHDFIEKVLTSYVSNIHYIPHHAVQKESHKNCLWLQLSPIRVLSKFKWLSYGWLVHIIRMISVQFCWFRFHVIGLSTDIEKAFLHARLYEGDRDYSRFSNPSNPDSVFQTYHFEFFLDQWAPHLCWVQLCIVTWVSFNKMYVATKLQTRGTICMQTIIISGAMVRHKLLRG